MYEEVVAWMDGFDAKGRALRWRTANSSREACLHFTTARQVERWWASRAGEKVFKIREMKNQLGTPTGYEVTLHDRGQWDLGVSFTLEGAQRLASEVAEKL